MPKGILEFSLPEEAPDFHTAQKASDFKLTLSQIADQIFRRRRKYMDLSEIQRNLVEEMENEFWTICREYDVDPNE